MPGKTILAVIFDVDGTIIDSERVQSDSYLSVLIEHGVMETELTEHGTIHIPGEPTNATWERLKRRHGIKGDTEDLSLRKRNAALEALNGNLEPLPGLLPLIAELQSHGIKLGLASTAQKERLEKIVRGLKLSGVFDVLISANDVERTKPAPDPYLKAVADLGVHAESCIVIEDAEVGVAAAKAAGMKVVAVPNAYTSKMDFSKADLIVDSLEVLNYASLCKLFSDNKTS